MQKASLKWWSTHTTLHSNIFFRTAVFTVTATRTSNPTWECLEYFETNKFGITIYVSTRFDVFMPETVIMIIFWDVVPCSLVTFQRSLLSLFSEQKCHWAAGSSKTLVPTYKTTQCYIPQNQILDNFSYNKQHSLIKT